MTNFYKKFKSKYRNKYYYIRSRYEIYFRYIYFSILKIILAPFFLILFPLFKYLKKNKIYFLTDIMSGVGHIVPEFDAFYLKYHYFNKIVFISNGHTNYELIINNYKFYKVYSGKLFVFIVLFVNFYPKLNIISSQTLPDHKMLMNIFSNKYNINYYFKYYNRYLKLRQKNESFFKNLLNDKFFKNKSIISKKKIACIHYRENISHAVPQISSPKSYIKSINYLLENNYIVYFIGREKLPKEFQNLNIINYASSLNKSLIDDFKIIYKSDLNIICGSGLSYIPDTLDKKYLYINSWHISRPGGLGKKSIFVPSLIKSVHSDDLISFSDQAKIENQGSHLSSAYIDKNKYSLIHASEDDVYEALIELIDIDSSKLNNLQIKFKDLIKNYGWDRSSESRISSNFLKKYEKLLN